MNTTNGMTDTSRFVRNDKNTKRADKAINHAAQKSDIASMWWISRSDKDTGNILVFFPLELLKKNRKINIVIFLSTLRENWKKAKLEIIEQKEIFDTDYALVGFSSLFFRLKRV